MSQKEVVWIIFIKDDQRLPKRQPFKYYSNLKSARFALPKLFLVSS